jgi:hypothetical protein
MAELPLVYTRSETNNLLLRHIVLGGHRCEGQRTLLPQHYEHRTKGRVLGEPANRVHYQYIEINVMYLLFSLLRTSCTRPRVAVAQFG